MSDEIEISVEHVSLPARSSFAIIAPIGVGTAEVEGLWSYAYRWAAAHGLTLYGLLCRMLPNVFTGSRNEADKAKGDVYQTYCSSRLNGCFSARNFLTKIDGRVAGYDLKMLSNLSLEDAISDNLGLRSHRAWCPQCYQEDAVPYDRLSWSWKSVTCCGLHEAVLIENCPDCGVRQRFRGSASDIAKCERCSAPLIVDASPRPEMFELYVARVAAQVIEMGQRGVMTANCVELFWSNVCAASRTVGGITVLSKLLGMSRTTLFCAHRDRKPLDTVLVAKVTWMTGVSVDVLLSERREFAKLADPLLSWSAVRRAPLVRGARDSDAVLMELLERMRDNPYRPVVTHKLALSCNISVKHPAFGFPMVRELLRTQRRVAVRTQRAMAVWNFCARVQNAIIKVESEGHTPGISRLGRAILSAGILRNEGARRIRDGFLRAVRAGFRDVLITRTPPLYLQAAAKRSK